MDEKKALELYHKKIEYNKEFNKKTYKQISLKINKDRKDLISWIEKQENKNAYIISLIEKDMNKNK